MPGIHQPMRASTWILAALLMASYAGIAAQRPAGYDEEFEKARQLLQQQDYFNALKGFQRANQAAGGRSAESFLGMAQAMQGMKVYKNALDACQSAIDLAEKNSRVLIRAHKLKGQVFRALADHASAEAELRAALAADPGSIIPDVHYELALTLLQTRRDDEAIAELRREIELRPNGSTAEEARALIANPRRGREKYAPEFSFVSTDGRTFSLDTLRGKVVLLDFWASWCDPCRRALPSVKKVQKDHAADPLVVIGVSGDTDERAWRAFMDKNAMVWPQYLDQDHRLQVAFGVNAIPTYVLLDAEGIEVSRVVGSGFHEARALSGEIDKQLKRVAQPRP